MIENNKNAFELLQEENEAKFSSYSSNIKSNIDGRRDIWSFFGELIELYFPKILSAILGGATLNSKSEESKDSK